VNVPTVYNVPPPALPLPFPASLLKARQDYNANFAETAPSLLGAPSIFSQIQESNSQKVAWSRPPKADSPIPVLLFHRIMRDFVDDCDNHQPVDKDNSLVLNLTDAMSQFFLTETARTAQLRNILLRHEIPITASTFYSKGHEFQTDGAIEYGDHLTSIFVVKNEIGGTGAEPYTQAILYYHHSALEQKYARA
jgi:hypothetical protein